MKHSSEIKKQRFLQAVQNILDKTRIFENRFVLFEKFIEPSEYHFAEDEVLVPDQEVDMFYNLFRSRSYSYMLWHNRSGELHSYNDMPSKISLSSDFKELNLQWHKNGIPYRNNEKFNKFEYFIPTYEIENGFNFSVEWLNENGELHSLNDMPAKITNSSISWFWNGENCRMSYGYEELPCNISKLGHMTFKKHKNDSSESVNYPLSTKHYGAYVLRGLYRYEKYVKWPIRQMLTL